MMDRDRILCEFLDRQGWARAERRSLAGDASNRRYERLRDGDRVAVLMDAPAERGEDIRPFLRVANHLTEVGLSAPRIMAADPDAGLILLEDLGDALYVRAANMPGIDEMLLYRTAADALLALQAAPPMPGLASYDPPTMARAAGLAATWYAGRADQADRLVQACESVLSQLDWHKPVVVLRDYHAENLLWMPDRDGAARVGLLDFQDAMLGHPVYDLVSLMQDARRDVPVRVAEAALSRFAEGCGQSPASLRGAVVTLGAQRALRILGVFARLSLHFAKPGYLKLIPRVWSQLQENLVAPGLEDLAWVCADLLPEPGPAHLADLEARCGTIPTR